MADELRDRIAEAIQEAAAEGRVTWDGLEQVEKQGFRREADAVLDALGLHYVESEGGAWRAVSAWMDGDPPHVF